ncbi:hypothetical protein JXC34_04440 [Candidatus Woesearchaeota archaeon]|nr:hypothetical protein [Candidatus Woesearchaeota archaeon]
MINILLVIDVEKHLERISGIFHGYATITSFLYDGYNTIPSESFDWTILDELDGWLEVATSLKGRCQNILVYSANERILREAVENNYPILDKMSADTRRLLDYIIEQS